MESITDLKEKENNKSFLKKEVGTLSVRGISIKDFIEKFIYWKPYKEMTEIAGNVITRTTFEKVGFYGGNGNGGRKVNKKKVTVKENRDKVLRKMSKLLIGYTNVNFGREDMIYKLITLEFKIPIKDIKTANKYFNLFIKRLRYIYGKDFKYIAMIDFHTGRINPERKGVIHYHIISDIERIENKVLRKIWNNGFVQIKQAYNIDNIGAYLRGYLGKKIYDKRLEWEMAYLKSRNLKKSLKLYGNVSWEYWQKNKELLEKNETWRNPYTSKIRGAVSEKEYILNQTALGKEARRIKWEKHCEKMNEAVKRVLEGKE